ncbi:hypothetical protein N7475_009194 [Penicillium sp. IBT 31633x]|nr:hypothetical protein N7475_009194 [Penicillium sp. IBT 31633x]
MFGIRSDSPLILRRSGGYSDTTTWYDQDADLSYTIADAPNSPRPSVLLSEDHPDIVKVYDAGDATAVWSVGNSAFCKVKLRLNGAARQPSTIRFVQQRQPGFETPNLLHESSCLFTSRVPGRTLGEAWPSLEKEWKHRYVNAIVKVCETLASWKSDTLRGVDGTAPEGFLAEYGAENRANR